MSEQAQTRTAPAGWYPDPGRLGLRYWDGESWTPHVSPTPAGLLSEPGRRNLAVGLVLTALRPGPGLVYLAVTSRGTPRAVATGILVTVTVLLVLLPVLLVAWFVALEILVGDVAAPTVQTAELPRGGLPTVR